jgi:hypothetical protein
VSTERITNIVIKVDSDGYLAIRFDIVPGSTFMTSNVVAFKSFVTIFLYSSNDNRIQLTMMDGTTIPQLKAYYNWTGQWMMSRYHI